MRFKTNIAQWIAAAIGARDNRIKELEAAIDEQRGDTITLNQQADVIKSKNSQITELETTINEQDKHITMLNRQLICKVKEISLLETANAHRDKSQLVSSKARPIMTNGDLVLVEARSWAGMHDEGGRAWVTDTNDDDTINVKYVLGGRRSRDISLRHVTKVIETGKRPKRNSTSDAAACSAKNICNVCHRLVHYINVGGEVMCHGCEQWFHLQCIRKTRSWLKSIKQFYCEKCCSKRH